MAIYMNRVKIGVGLVSFLLLQPAFAGRLDDFEKKAGEKKKSSPKSESRDYPSGRGHFSSFGSGTYPSGSRDDSFLGSLATWLISAPFRYRYDDPAAYENRVPEEDEWAGGDSGWLPGHRQGSATMPYFRAGYHWQFIDSDLDAQDVQIETGYKFFAFHGRYTLYTEHNPHDELMINQYYGVLRYGGELPGTQTGSWEAGIGFGVAHQDGNEENSSGAITLPVKIYPAEWIGFEFRPAWYGPQERGISDYDISVSLGPRYLQFHGGYRGLWLQGFGRFFSGPYAGLSISF